MLAFLGCAIASCPLDATLVGYICFIAAFIPVCAAFLATYLLFICVLMPLRDQCYNICLHSRASALPAVVQRSGTV